MSRQLINEYRADLDRLRTVSGSRRESVLREAFKDLLKRWGRTHNLQFIPEHDIVTVQKNRIYLDGALLHALRVPFGYWEAKDADDDLDKEIEAKSRKGYPRDNIVYSDDHTAVLIQDGRQVARVAMDDVDALYNLLGRFFAHERQEIADFNKAVRQFSEDLPAVLAALRDMVAKKRVASARFRNAEVEFLQHAQEAINPAVTEGDIQEMLIQHILTEDIFAKVFDNPDFHRQNNIASELYKLEDSLFARGEKSTLLRALAPYYSGIARTAAVIQSHSEKQGFLKGLYENFYKVYNAKAADKLGVVYTPGEIVRFMIRSVDWLCEQNFGKNLIDNGVDILDPATGTGTFIVELLEHFRGNHAKLARKYTQELHANEVAILPYYVANLNIEATYQSITGKFIEFENLCFVDTLDNVDALGIYSGHQFDLLGALTDENIERIKRQNRRKISVIIGNPPYNANQQNENDNNKNRVYAHIDKRIKNTYIKESTAQKTKLYDMYARFYRWASDRVGDEGVVAFITNRSFIDSRTFDGFRKLVASDFQDIWIIDLGGDVRANPKLSGTKHNVFGIQTGVAIAFLIRHKAKRSGVIRYVRRPENETAEEKLSWLGSTSLEHIQTETIKPDARHTWVGFGDNEFDSFLPVLDRNATASRVFAIFSEDTVGINTARDEWAYDDDADALARKMKYFLKTYEGDLDAAGHTDHIKWSEALKAKKRARKVEAFAASRIRPVLYRPFTQRLLYGSNLIIDRYSRTQELFPGDTASPAISVSIGSPTTPFQTLGTECAVDFHATGESRALPRYRYTSSGDKVDNITDWALNKFVKKYGKKGVTKDTIFYYVYAVFHDPVYRETYALNLKREFPRIPLYCNFQQWASWGEALMTLHSRYEQAKPWKLKRTDRASKRAADTTSKPILKSYPEEGKIVIDAETELSGIPLEAWSYRLGNRSVIDWVLDQRKEKKPRDATIAAQFNTYVFAGQKEPLIELLGKVVRISVETVAITTSMAALSRKDA